MKEKDMKDEKRTKVHSTSPTGISSSRKWFKVLALMKIVVIPIKAPPLAGLFHLTSLAHYDIIWLCPNVKI